jgi:hypothetical protein
MFSIRTGRLGAAPSPSASSTRTAPNAAAPAASLPLGWIFAGLSLILLAVVPPGTPSGDGLSMLAVADGLATGPTVEVDCEVGIEGRDGECFSNFYPLLSVLATPLVWLGRELGGAIGVPPVYAGHMLALVIPALAAAGAATLSADLARRLGANRKGAVATAVAVAFATEMLTYSRSFFAETLVAFCVVLAVWGLTGRSSRKWLGLLGITLAVLAKPQVVLFGPALGVALAIHRRSVRPLVETSVATAVGSLILLAYNWIRFESLTDFGGDARTLSPSAFAPPEALEAIGLLTISPGRGLIWFSPVAALGLYVLWTRRREAIPLVCLVSCVGLIVLYIGNPGSGFNWGTRYLVALLPLLCIPLGTLRGNMARLALVLALVGFVSQVPNLVGFYHRYHREQADIGIKPEAHHWSIETSQLVGVWPATIRQVEAAADKDVDELVSGGTTSGGTTENQVLLNVIALWWWGLPAAGVPWWFGVLVSLTMVGAGTVLLLRIAASRGHPLGPVVKQRRAVELRELPAPTAADG